MCGADIDLSTSPDAYNLTCQSVTFPSTFYLILSRLILHANCLFVYSYFGLIACAKWMLSFEREISAAQEWTLNGVCCTSKFSP